MYMCSGLACGLAAIILTARAHSGQPASGSQGLELNAISAAFLGGCGLRGGTGTIVGTLLGVVIIGTLNNGLILMGGAHVLSAARQGHAARRRGDDPGIPSGRTAAHLLACFLAKSPWLTLP